MYYSYMKDEERKRLKTNITNKNVNYLKNVPCCNLSANRQHVYRIHQKRRTIGTKQFTVQKTENQRNFLPYPLPTLVPYFE